MHSAHEGARGHNITVLCSNVLVSGRIWAAGAGTRILALEIGSVLVSAGSRAMAVMNYMVYGETE